MSKVSIEDAIKFYDEIPFEEIKSVILSKVEKSVDLKFSYCIDKYEEVEVILNSEDLSESCGVMSCAFKSVKLDLFNSSISRDKDTGEIYFWCTPHFSYELKDGGFNGVKICRIIYSKSRGLVVM